MKSKVLKALVNHFVKPLYPTEAILYITDNCNLKCAFCEIGLENLNGRSRRPVEISFAQVDKIMGALEKTGCRSLYVTGGEPFLSKSFWYLLRLCKEKDIRVDGVTTNGSTLLRITEEQRDILNSTRVKRIIISVDSPVHKEHDSLRGKSGLLASIEEFLGSELAASINTLYCISSVISSSSIDSLSDLVRWCDERGNIAHLNFQPVCDESIFVDYTQKDDSKEGFLVQGESIERLMNNIDDANALSKELGISTSLPFLKHWVREYFQYAKTDTFFFNKVMLQCSFLRPGHFLYNTPVCFLNLFIPE